MTESRRDSIFVELSSNPERVERQSSSHNIDLIYRNSTDNSDIDINFRIRSLLHSRNKHHPPRTPPASPENRRSSIEAEAEAVDEFNFVFKDTADQMILSSKREEVLGMSSARLSEDEPPNLDGEISRSTSDPTLVISRRETLLAEHGIEDCNIDTLPNLNDSSMTQGERLPFRIPRLVLRDAEPVNFMAVRSCGSANGDDLACFIAGCTHTRRSPLEIAVIREQQARRLQEDMSGGSLLVPRDVTAEAKRESLKLSGATPQVPTLNSLSESAYSQEGNGSIVVDSNLLPSPKQAAQRRGDTDNNGQHRISKFPVSMLGTTQIVAITDPFQQSLSTVVTDFSLPDPEPSVQDPGKPKNFNFDRQLIPKNEIRPGELAKAASFRTTNYTKVSSPAEVESQAIGAGSEFHGNSKHVRSLASLQSYQCSLEEPEPIVTCPTTGEQVTATFNRKPDTPSLLSGDSRITMRHALLKPTATMSPVDNGLPVQPILTREFVQHEVEHGKTQGLRFDDRIQKTSALVNLQTVDDLISTTKKQVTSSYTKSEDEAEPLESSLIIENSRHHARLTGSPNNLEFWGYPSYLKEGTEGAIQTAIRVAVRKIIVPSETEAEVASVVYRKIVGQSLSNAANMADTYLKRDDLWIKQAQNELSPLDSRENLTPSEATKTDHVDPEWKHGNRCKYGASPAYASIPTRDSSHKHKRPNMIIKSSPKNSNGGGGGPNFLQESSVGALTQTTSAVENRASHDPKEHNSRQNIPALGQESNPTGWLRGFLGSNLTHRTQLTKLPPRTTSNEESVTRRTKSPATHSNPINPRSRVTLHESLNPITSSLVACTDASKQIAVAEKFTKTIDDLELLLGEALVIARQATDQQDSYHDPSHMNNPVTVLNCGRKSHEDDTKINSFSNCHVHRRLKCFQMRSDTTSEAESVPSIHESFLSTSNSDASHESRNDEDFKDQENKLQPVIKIRQIIDHATQDKIKTTASNGKSSLSIGAGSRRANISQATQFTVPAIAVKQKACFTNIPNSDMPTLVSMNKQFSHNEEQDTELNTEKCIKKATNPLSSSLGIERISTSGISPMSRSRATTGYKQPQLWAQDEHGAAHNDNLANKMLNHVSQTASPLPTSQYRMAVLGTGNESELRTAPSMTNNRRPTGISIETEVS